MKAAKKIRVHSTVSTKAESVVLLPSRTRGSVIVTMSLAQSTILFANAGKTTSFATLVDRIDNPVDPCVSTNRFVTGIHQNNFIILVDTVLVNPVRVQHT